MQMGRTLGVFVSGCCVYTIMAACSSSGTMISSATSAGHGGHGGMAMMTGNGGVGMGGHGGVADDSGIFDALTDPVPDVMAMPGSRLKGKFLLGDDGSREYQYVLEFLPTFQAYSPVGTHQLWYDSMRQEDCTFRNAGDGHQRCLPTDYAEWIGSPTDGGNYADAACTIGVTPVNVPPVTCNFTPPKYALLTQASGSCPSDAITRRVFLLSQPANIQMGDPLYQMQNGMCKYTGTNNQNSAWYKIGAEVPAAMFVGAMPGIDP